MSYRRSSPHGHRPKLSSFRAGHVFFLPRGATWLNHDKPRPFVLATTSSLMELGIFVYGSTRRTEMASAAACVEVKPAPFGVNANGLRAPTFFYPGLMLHLEYYRLPAHVGGLGARLPAFRAAVEQALGLGTGTCDHPAAPRGSLRGRIVILHPDVAAEVLTPFAALLTEHVYSREKRYQLMVPLVRGDEVVALPGVPRVHDKPWFATFNRRTTSVLLAASMIQSVWHGDAIVGETGWVIDSASLSVLEDDLRVLFGISTPAE
jgi:hypothetical protein